MNTCSRNCIIVLRNPYLNPESGLIQSQSSVSYNLQDKCKKCVVKLSSRYGIFDEFGFPGDAVYPNFFRLGGNILPTGTSNEPVVGTWKSALDQASEGNINPHHLEYEVS